MGNRRTPLQETFAAMIYPLRMSDDAVWRMIKRLGIKPGNPLGAQAYEVSQALQSAEGTVRKGIPFDPTGL